MCHWKALLGKLLLVAAIVAASLVPGTAVAGNRDIDEFIAAQGTFCLDDGNGGCLLFVPPLQNFFGWSAPAISRCAAVDYAGIANAWIQSESAGHRSLGTRMDGSVREVALADGRAEIQVTLHTVNALAWVIDGCDDFAGHNLLMGYRAPEVLAGAPPALAETFLKVKFTITAPGAPLPDILQIAFAPSPGEELRFLSMYARAEGPLREDFGVAEGTRGAATIVQTGIFTTPFNGAVGDGFPVERVDLKALPSVKSRVN